MSDVIAPMQQVDQSPMRRHLAGRWQIPLLLTSSVLFGLGLWRLRPGPVVIPFDQQLAHVHALRNAGFHPEASTLAENLLTAEGRTGAERAQLHRAIADIIYSAEDARTVKTPENAERMLRHYRLSVADPEEFDAETHRRMGQAWEWLNRSWEAVQAYTAAVEEGYRDPVALRRRIIELKLAAGALAGEALAGELDSFVKLALEQERSPKDYVWAVHRRVELYLDADQPEDAEAYLETLRPVLGPASPEAERNLYDFLRGWIRFHQGRFDEAERLLRALRDRMTIRDDVDAASAWLLGRILQPHIVDGELEPGAPEVALGFFDTVLTSHFEGPYVAASKLGRAECLAQLERHGEALSAYRDAVAMLSRVHHTRIVSQQMIADSATRRWLEMVDAGKNEEALGYLRLAADLVPASDFEKRAVYVERVADLLSLLAQRDLSAAMHAEGASPEALAVEGGRLALQSRARERLMEAGEAYLRLADLTAGREVDSAAAVWKAADRFDDAGARERSIEVLEAYILGRPESPRMPAALLRLGQAYQALSQYAEAISRYQRAITEFPRTLSGIASMVPLAECFMAMGPEQAEQAEATLLSVLEEPPDRPPLITPDAPEFRDALFKIADLYMTTREYDRAIVRLEEALKRYPDDPRISRARYQLAEAYRLSAGELPAQMSEAKNLARREQLVTELRRRLRTARELYGDVIAAHAARGEWAETASGPVADLERAYVKMSHLYRADCLFDEQEYVGTASEEGYTEAMKLYDEAAWKYRTDPVALSAYVQLIHCHLRVGDLARARTTLERATWVLRGIPDNPEIWPVPGENKKTWADYLVWLADTPTFRASQQ